MNILTRLVAVTTIALVVPFLHTSSASAAQLQSSTGRPGYVGLNGPMITGYDHEYRLYGGGYLKNKSWEAAGFTAGASPAYAGTQDVVGFYVLQRYSFGSWSTMRQSPTYSGRVSPGGTLRFPQWLHVPENLNDTRYVYRIIYVVGWFVAGTNQSLASTVVMPSSTSDNRCVMRFGTRCDVYWDGIVF